MTAAASNCDVAAPSCQWAADDKPAKPAVNEHSRRNTTQKNNKEREDDVKYNRENKRTTNAETKKGKPRTSKRVLLSPGVSTSRFGEGALSYGRLYIT